jgi:N-methylhydantoinase B
MDTRVKNLDRTCDPVKLEIIKGSLRAAQLEMETLLERTSVSPVIREKKDFFAGYFDPLGQLITGTNLPIFGHIIQPIFEHYPAAQMREGDLYWYNDCYASKGGVSHMPDQVFAAPVFHKDRMVGFSQTWAHFNDIGGAWPGSMSPTATDIFQEGIMIPPVRLYREGVLNEEIYRIFLRNGRFPEEMRGDIRAMIAAVRLGEKRFIEIFERFGADISEDAFSRLNDQTRNGLIRQLRETFKPGTYRFTDGIDSDGQGHGPFMIRMSLKVTDQRIEIDTSETDDQAPGPVNFLMNPAVPKMVFGIYAMSRDPSLLINEGAMHAVDEVKVREGSLLQPRFPAPLNQRGLTLIRTVNVCAGLMNVASNGQSVAATAAYSIYFLRGHDPQSGRAFLIADGVGVGHGARSFADGHNGVYYVAQDNNPAEFLEQMYPMRLLRYQMSKDSGGPGKFRGGTGVIRELVWLGPDAILAIRIDGIRNPAWGVSGGQAGRPGNCFVNHGTPAQNEVSPLSDGTLVRSGDVIRFQTCGGGGWGHPFDRDAQLVLDDVRGSYVSVMGAQDDYGVVVRSLDDELVLDHAATAALRATQRPPSRLFHNGAYVDAMV